MKMLIGAIALIIAVPAAAQAAPVASPDAPHAEHRGKDHGQHHQAMHDCMECCRKMKEGHGKMDCMDKRGDAKTPAPAPSGHEGHDAH